MHDTDIYQSVGVLHKTYNITRQVLKFIFNLIYFLITEKKLRILLLHKLYKILHKKVY